MPTRVPHHQIVVHRDGKNIRVPIGKPFDFTQDEVDQVRESHPHALRHPVNEGRAAPMPEVTSDFDDAETETDDAAPVKLTAAARRAAARRAAAPAPEDDEL